MAVKHREPFGNTERIIVDADPSGAVTGIIGSSAYSEDGRETWRNTDGATAWARVDSREALGLERYVDSGNTDSAPNGSAANPYTTIQAAITDIAAAAAASGSAAERIIHVYGGPIYDEDLTIPQTDGGAWSLIAHTQVRLGVLPGTPRSITRIADPAAAHPLTTTVLRLTTEDGGKAWMVVGGIALSDVGAGRTQNLTLRGAGIIGIGVASAIDATGQTGACGIYSDDSDVSGPVTGSTVTIQIGQHNVFAACDVLQLNAGLDNVYGAVTVTAVGTGYLRGCEVGGDWTGPAGSFRVDHSTLGAFVAAGHSLLGGATLDLLDPHAATHSPLGDDAVPAQTLTDGQLWVSFMGGEKSGGVWATVNGSGNNFAVRRTGSVTGSDWYTEAPLMTRGTASRGVKITGYKSVYKITTGPVGDARAVVYTRSVPADGAGMPAKAAIAGLVDGEYDVSHDTAAKRGVDNGAGGIRWHTATVTLAAPAFVAAGNMVSVEMQVIADGAGVGLLDYYGTMLYYDWVPLD